ncbi:MAG: DUF2442 domain-containing protein [Clostridia bacterium]
MYPAEVTAYLENGPRSVKSVHAKAPYIIVAQFDDGVLKEYDMGPELTGVLASLKDFELFKKVYVDDTGSIAWDSPEGHIDTSKDTVYIYGS